MNDIFGYPVPEYIGYYLVLNQAQRRIYERELGIEINEGDMVLGGKVVFARYMDSDELVGGDEEKEGDKDSGQSS